MGEASVLLWVMRFPLPSLPASNESAMNYEGLGLLLSQHLLFLAALTFHEFRRSTAGFSERDPHRMMRMRDLDEGLV
jgi:hypothetical protein